MNINNIAALFGAMVVLAAIPSLSVFTVVSIALSSGFMCGTMAAIGIVVGDIIFIVLAIYGLSAIASTEIDTLLFLLKYFGGIYLICLGIILAKSKPQSNSLEEISESSLLSSFLSGLLITLGDQKAIFFYVSFFPAFVDLHSLSKWDSIIILGTAIVAVGGVKLSYVYLAERARAVLNNPQIKKTINFIAAVIMVGAGFFLIAKN
ncbi:MAG: LysE family translocator [Cyanobacteria bacterium P01_G01_bin.19]